MRVHYRDVSGDDPLFPSVGNFTTGFPNKVFKVSESLEPNRQE